MGLRGKTLLLSIFVLFSFFFTSLGLCVTPDLSLSRNGVKDAMIWEDEDRMASGLRVT